MDYFDIDTARRLYIPEKPDTYKNQRGRVLVIGGSCEYGGAPFLSGISALRAGAGICTVAIPHNTRICGNQPNALIIRELPDDGTGHLAISANSPEISELTEHADCLVLGPGLTTSDSVVDSVAALLSLPLPKIIDADALNILASRPVLHNDIHVNNVIITPHRGEFSRLVKGMLKTDYNPDKAIEQAMELAHYLGTTIVLKGYPTYCISPQGEITENTTGGPALATAGSGDCLAGIIAAFVAKNHYTMQEAARLGVFMHGLSGDILQQKSPMGHIADDIPNALVEAWRVLLT